MGVPVNVGVLVSDACSPCLSNGDHFIVLCLSRLKHVTNACASTRVQGQAVINV